MQTNVPVTFKMSFIMELHIKIKQWLENPVSFQAVTEEQKVKWFRFLSHSPLCFIVLLTAISLIHGAIITNIMTFVKDTVEFLFQSLFSFISEVIWFALNFCFIWPFMEQESSCQINHAINEAKSGLPLRPLLLQMCWFWQWAIKGVTRAIDQGNCGIRLQIGAKITRCRGR